MAEVKSKLVNLVSTPNQQTRVFFFSSVVWQHMQLHAGLLKSHERPTVAPNWAGSMRTLSPRCRSRF